jgi:uncharacterized membrane protein
MKNRTSFLVSAGLGAGLMYLFDPERGRRRRAMVRDQLTHVRHRARDAFDATRSDLTNRGQGMGASLRNWIGTGEASDPVLAERVRSVIGRIVAHPGSINVKTDQGRVVLSGPVLAKEVDRLIDRVGSVRGVRALDNQLDVYLEPGNVPGLQGEPQNRGQQRFELMQENWSPTARVLVGSGALLTALYGLGRRGVGGTLLGLGSLAVLSRAVTNLDFRRLFGIGAGRHAVEFEKTVQINAPVERVFDVWSHYENFPQFMTHVREVKSVAHPDQRRWRWTVEGPARMPVTFETIDVEQQPNRLIRWRSVPGSLIASAGTARFRSNPDGTTTIHIHFGYNPVAGAAGHAVARVLGADPKSQMDDDLMRMKSFIETGVRPHDAASVIRH